MYIAQVQSSHCIRASRDRVCYGAIELDQLATYHRACIGAEARGTTKQDDHRTGADRWRGWIHHTLDCFQVSSLQVTTIDIDAHAGLRQLSPDAAAQITHQI